MESTPSKKKKSFYSCALLVLRNYLPLPRHMSSTSQAECVDQVVTSTNGLTNEGLIKNKYCTVIAISNEYPTLYHKYE